MSLAVLFTSTSQGNSLIQGYVITDNCGLTDDNTISMIDEKTLADLRTGMNLNAGLAHSAL